MAEIASAYVSLLPSAKGFGAGLDKQVGSQVDQSGKKAGRRFGTALKVGALAVAGGAALATKLLGSSIRAASDLAENESKVGVVFGKSAAQVLKASKTSATAMGISKSAYLAANGTLGNLLVSLDIAPGKAANMSQQMVKLAGDLASFNNVSPEEALDALRSGLVGETEPLKRFGVNMNETTLKAEALKMGLVKTTKEALTPQNKALAAQSLIMKQTKTAQGDFARTSGGLANQQRILTAQTDDLKAAIGERLLPVATKIVNWANDFVKGMKDGTGAGGKFADILDSVGSTLSDVGGFLKDNRDVLIPFTAAVLGGVAAFKAITSVVRAYTAVQAALNFVMAANPIGIVVVAIAALVAGLIVAYKRSETFRAIVDGAFKAVGKAATWLWEKAIKPAFKFIVNTWLTVVGALLSGAAKAFGWVPGIGPKLKTAADKFQQFKEDVNRQIDGVKDPKIQVRTTGADHAISSLQTIKQLIKDINSAKPGKKGAQNLTQLLGGRVGRNARGTKNWGGGLSWVGENGPEILNLPRGSQVIPNHRAGDFIRRQAPAASGASYNFYTFDLDSAVRDAQRREAFAGGA